MVIPLWLHPTYNPRSHRLCLIKSETSQIEELAMGSLSLVTPAAVVPAVEVVVDSSFVCPITAQSLPECACMKSSLKLHDFCVFCPAARLSS